MDHEPARSRTLLRTGEAVPFEATVRAELVAWTNASRESTWPIVPMLRAGGWSSATGRVTGRGR
jgi:hypothetical protein